MDTERMNAADAYDYNQVQQLVQLDSELQGARKLPEGQFGNVRCRPRRQDGKRADRYAAAEMRHREC